MRTRTALLAAILSLASCRSYFDFSSDGGAIALPVVGGDAGGLPVDSGFPEDGGPIGVDAGHHDAGPFDAGHHDAGVIEPIDAGESFDAGEPFYDAGVSPDMTDAGTITVLASNETSPQAIAVGGGMVYFTHESDPGYVAEVPVAGGMTVTLTDTQHNPVAIAVDSNNVYWVNVGTYSGGGGGQQYNNDGTVMKLPIGGTAPVTLAMNQLLPSGIAVDSQNVYWINAGIAGDDGTVMSVPIAGGNATTIISNQNTPTAISVTPNSEVYWAVYGTTGNRGTYNNDGAIYSASIDGGSVLTIATGQLQPDGIATDNNNVYWCNTGQPDPRQSGVPIPSTGSVAYAPLSGGMTVTVSQGEDWPTAVVTDTSFVYWLDTGSTQSNGSISGVPLAGGPPQILVYAGINSFALAETSADLGPGPIAPPRSTTLFWTDLGSMTSGGAVNEFKPGE